MSRLGTVISAGTRHQVVAGFSTPEQTQITITAKVVFRRANLVLAQYQITGSIGHNVANHKRRQRKINILELENAVPEIENTQTSRKTILILTGWACHEVNQVACSVGQIFDSNKTGTGAKSDNSSVHLLTSRPLRLRRLILIIRIKGVITAHHAHAKPKVSQTAVIARFLICRHLIPNIRYRNSSNSREYCEASSTGHFRSNTRSSDSGRKRNDRSKRMGFLRAELGQVLIIERGQIIVLVAPRFKRRRVVRQGQGHGKEKSRQGSGDYRCYTFHHLHPSRGRASLARARTLRAHARGSDWTNDQRRGAPP